MKDWEFDPGRQPDVSPYVIVLNVSPRISIKEVTCTNYLFTSLANTAFFLLLCSISHAHHSGFQPRRTKQWQHGVGGHEEVRHYAVGVHKHHLSAPHTPARPLSGPCTGWKQWLPPDKVQLQWETLTWKCFHQSTHHLKQELILSQDIFKIFSKSFTKGFCFTLCKGEV